MSLVTTIEALQKRPLTTEEVSTLNEFQKSFKIDDVDHLLVVLALMARSQINGDSVPNLLQQKVTETIEKFLMQAVKTSLVEATEKATTKILTGDGGPVTELKELVKQQTAALSWLNRASNYYANNYVIWPMAISCFISALVGGAIAGIILKLF